MNKVLGIAGLIAVVIFTTVVILHGNARYAEGEASCKASIAENTVAQVKKREKTKQEVIRLNDADLVRRYCKWVYDLPYDECVRSVKPIP